jgi:hypothetical protein
MANFIGDLMQRSIICVLFLFLIGCANRVDLQPEPIQTIQDVTKHEWQSLQTHIGRQWINPQGVGIGFVWEEERNLSPSERSSTEDIHVEQGQLFNPYLILNAPEKTTVLVTALLDYAQIEFELNGKRGLLHEITIEPGSDLELPMRIDIQNEGMHDLIVIAFVDPYNKTLDSQYRSSMDSRMVGRRAVITVGKSKNPVLTLGPALAGNPIPQNVNLNLGAAFATASNHGHPSDLDRQLYIANINSGTTFNYQIWVSNLGGTQASEYYLMLFFDYHQTRIRDRDSLLIDLDPKEEIIIDSDIRIPERQSIYQMQLVYVLDPYKSIANEEVEAPFVFSSSRIAINAQP